jgi:hypothetical protein
MDERSFNRLVLELKSVGFVEPIQVVPYDAGGQTRYRILGGEHRFRAAKIIGLAELPAILLTDPKFQNIELQKALTVRLQVLRGKLNKTKMVKLFQDFADKHSSEEIQDLFAVTSQDEWQKLVGETRKNLKKGGMSNELLEEFDRNVKEARSVDDLGNIVRHLYEMYQDTVPYGFMIFTWGKKEHIYIAMSKQLKQAMDGVLAQAKKTKQDVNQILTPAIEKLVASLPPPAKIEN